MPLPNPHRTTIENTVSFAGRVIDRSTATLWNGRTQWNGNQRRRFVGKLQPPTALNTLVVKTNTGFYTGGNPKGWYRQGSLIHAYAGIPIVQVEHSPSEGDKQRALASAVNSFSKEAGLGVTLAETPSSLRLIGRRTTTVFQILMLAGKGKFRQAGERLKAVTGYNVSNRSIKRLEKRWTEKKAYDSRRASSFWLETQFGFAPLLQTIYDAISELERSEVTRRRTGKSNGAKFGIYASVINTSEYTAARLGLLNPALIVWDKIPFSFVLDWFLPISTILRWMGSRRGLGPRYAWSSTTSKKSQSIGGVHWKTETRYFRYVERLPSIGDIFNASSRSHGLWTVTTSLALLNTLR